VGISAVLIVLNEEDKIEKCLSSLGWADKIVIVDGFSTDNTVQTCEKYTKNIFQNKFDDFSSQKNFALSKAGNEWVLFLDADEKVPEELKQEILETIKKSAYSGYFIPRNNYIFGRLMKYGGHQNDTQMRLFKKDKARFENPVHEVVEIEGTIGILKNHIEHYSSKNISSYMARFNRYTDFEAEMLYKRKAKFRARYILLKPVAKFIYQYFWKRGYRDGIEGFIYYVFSAVYIGVKYIKYWEKTLNGNEKLV